MLLCNLGVDDEEWVVRVFDSGLHDWITEPLIMLVGNDHHISAKELVDYCTHIELSKSIRHGAHFDANKRDGAAGHKPVMKNNVYDQSCKREAGPAQGYAKIGIWNAKLQLTSKDTCKLCGTSGHWTRECPKRQGGIMKPAAGNVAVNVDNGKVCSHCGKNGHLVDDCYTLKNEMKQKEGAYPRASVAPSRFALRTVQGQEMDQHPVRTMSLTVSSVRRSEPGVFPVMPWLLIVKLSAH